MVPIPLIIVLFLVSFLLTIWQYSAVDPRRRILNVRFALLAGSVIAFIWYPIFIHIHPDDRHTSWLMLAWGVLWLVWAFYLLRHMPPREEM